MIQTKLVIIATTLNTIRYSIFTLFSSLVMKSEPALHLDLAFITAWTRMAPAIAIAPGDRFGLAHSYEVKCNVLQHQPGCFGFAI